MFCSERAKRSELNGIRALVAAARLETLGFEHCWWALLLVTLLGATNGCATAHYLQNRDIRDNALTNSLQLMRWKGPEISTRTQGTLRRYGLSETYGQNCDVCINQLRSLNHQNTDSELTYAVSEPRVC